jgi:peptidyl-prolyl cis-trans isomerase C
MPSYYQNIVDRNKKRFLDEMIVETMFYEEAVRKGIGRDHEIKEIIKEAEKKILIAKLIKSEVEDKIEVKDDEVRNFYEAHKDDFKTPELWRASHILVATEEEAKSIRDDISKGASFEELARTRSMDATASRGGDIGYFRQGQLVPDFEKACLELKTGDLSDIVHTQFGYHVIKLTDKKEPAAEAFEKVRQKIEDELKKKKRSELFDNLVLKLKEKYNVHIEEDVFKSLEALNEEKAAGK